MPPTLTTERLTLRPLTQADSAVLHAIYSHSRMARFMPNPPQPDSNATWANVARSMGLEGAVHWAICVTKEGERPVGVVNYLGQTAVPGMGYAVHPAYWNRGIATEACRAALDYGFDEMALDRVELWIDETNAASRRVAEKLGFKLRGRQPMKYDHNPHGHIMLVYGVWAEEWRGDVPPAVLEAFRAEPVLPVRDVMQSVEFYTGVLGFRVGFLYGEPTDYAGVLLGAWSGGGVSIHLNEVPREVDITPSGQIFMFVDGDIDGLYARVQAAGTKILAPLEAKPWGFREFILTDPDGHRLRFATHG